MLKRSWIVAALLAAQAVSASQYDYEFSPLIGFDITEGNLQLENETILGGEFQFNHLIDFVLKPELSVYYATDTDYTYTEPVPAVPPLGATYDTSPESTHIWRIGVGGVYDYADTGKVRPFAKIGLGYESMSNALYGNVNSLYADAGLGVKIPLAAQVAFKAEALYMLKNNDNRYDNNLMVLAGLSFAFGGGAPAAPATKSTASGRYDSDGDGVSDNNDQCPNTPKGTDVDAYGCPYDSDHDGVADLSDKCPDTPVGFQVDIDGCPETFAFNVTFATDSARVTSTNMEQIDRFVSFMKSNNYKANIVGRADDRGTDAYNETLSKKRAEAVLQILVSKGIPAERLTAVAKGETDPVATNATAAGRAQNRSVRAELDQ